MRTDRDEPLTHTSARMMKLATGVALTSCITGGEQGVHPLPAFRPPRASTALDSAPSPKPSRMRPALNATRCQNSACGQQLHQRPQRLHRRDQKDLLPDGHGRRLPDAPARRPTPPRAEGGAFLFFPSVSLLLFFFRFQNITSCERIQSFIFSSLDMKGIKLYTVIKQSVFHILRAPAHDWER